MVFLVAATLIVNLIHISSHSCRQLINKSEIEIQKSAYWKFLLRDESIHVINSKVGYVRIKELYLKIIITQVLVQHIIKT